MNFIKNYLLDWPINAIISFTYKELFDWLVLKSLYLPKKLINKIFITKLHKDNMKSHSKGPQVLAPDDFPLIQTPSTTPNQTLP